MDEASSRFVDKIALERLVHGKLALVRHRPTASMSDLEKLTLRDLVRFDAQTEVSCGRGPETTLLRSKADDLDPLQDWCPLVHYHAPNPKGTLLLVHGLFEDNRNIYGYLIGELNKHGYSVYLTTLPYHYERTPQSSAFSGEYFFSADLGRTKAAFCRACAEVHQAYQWLTASSSGPTFVVGFSMGAAVSLAVAALSHAFRGLFVINPAASLTDVMWTSPLCQTLKRDLIDAGYHQSDIERVLASFDPCLLTHPAMDLARIQMSYALYDQVTSIDQYEALIKRWNLSNVRSYKAGHLNTLRVPRLAEDIATFFNGLSITPAY